MKKEFIITPKTKIFDIIIKYPEVEDFLIELVPSFEKLKNPILRNTIASVASIEQAAIIGGMEIELLIGILSKKLNLKREITIPEELKDSSNWNLSNYIILQKINVEDITNKGAKSLLVILDELKNLMKNEIIILDSNFYPDTLINKAIEAGFDVLIKENLDYSYTIYFSVKNN